MCGAPMQGAVPNVTHVPDKQSPSSPSVQIVRAHAEIARELPSNHQRVPKLASTLIAL